jgi:hypothetical protein
VKRGRPATGAAWSGAGPRSRQLPPQAACSRRSIRARQDIRAGRRPWLPPGTRRIGSASWPPGRTARRRPPPQVLATRPPTRRAPGMDSAIPRDRRELGAGDLEADRAGAGDAVTAGRRIASPANGRRGPRPARRPQADRARHQVHPRIDHDACGTRTRPPSVGTERRRPAPVRGRR